MKQLALLFASVITAAGALLLTGCSSVPTEVENHAIKASTFSFVSAGTPARAEYAENRQQAHALIQQALSDNLAAKGLSKAASGGDVTVAYLVVVGNNATTESINTYFGYGRDASELQYKAHKAYTSTDNPNYFEAGTLLVDLIDSKTFKLLYRAHVTRPMLRNPTAEVQATHIREAVDSVLKDLKVASK